MDKKLLAETALFRYWGMISIIVLGITGVWVFYSSTQLSVTRDSALQAPQVGFVAPDISVVDGDGNQVQLRDFRGQPVLLNIWASWCPPCRAEMPAMEQVFQDYSDQGFKILAINSTHQDDPASAIAFYDQLGLSFGLLFDTDGSVSRAYQIRSLPTSFFISPDGIIREIVIGGPMAEALLVTRVENLLEGDF